MRSFILLVFSSILSTSVLATLTFPADIRDRNTNIVVQSSDNAFLQRQQELNKLQQELSLTQVEVERSRSERRRLMQELNDAKQLWERDNILYRQEREKTQTAKGVMRQQLKELQSMHQVALTELRATKANDVISIETQTSKIRTQRMAALEEEIAAERRSRLIAVENDMRREQAEEQKVMAQEISQTRTQRMAALEEEIAAARRSRLIAVENDMRREQTEEQQRITQDKTVISVQLPQSQISQPRNAPVPLSLQSSKAEVLSQQIRRSMVVTQPVDERGPPRITLELPRVLR